MKTVFTQTRLPTVELCDIKENLHAMRYMLLSVNFPNKGKQLYTSIATIVRLYWNL